MIKIIYIIRNYERYGQRKSKENEFINIIMFYAWRCALIVRISFIFWLFKH